MLALVVTIVFVSGAVADDEPDEAPGLLNLISAADE